MRKTWFGIGMAGALMGGAWLAGTGVATATLPMQKQAKLLGYAAANCQYCHVDKLPKKGAAESNERGKWLHDEKEKRKAKEVDVAWLKGAPHLSREARPREGRYGPAGRRCNG